MQGENRSLKQQLAKTAEVIMKLQETEKSLIQKLVNPFMIRTQFSGVLGTSTRLDRERPECIGKEISRK